MNTDLIASVSPGLPAERLATRAKIERMEMAMRGIIASGEGEESLHDGGTEEGDAECTHHFADGVYVRTLLIPAGTAVVGRLHKQSRVCIVSSGKCTFTDEFQRQTVEGPWIGEFRAGTKTAVYAHTDTLWSACSGVPAGMPPDPKTLFKALTAGHHNDILLE